MDHFDFVAFFIKQRKSKLFAPSPKPDQEPFNQIVSQRDGEEQDEEEE